MIYGVVFSLQEKEITEYCFEKCGKVILGSFTDPEIGALTACRKDDCPFEETRTPVIGDVEGEKFIVRKLKPIIKDKVNVDVLLDQLAELQSKKELTKFDFANLRTSIIPDEIREKLDGINVEEHTAMDNLNSEIEKITNEIKGEVIKLGISVKGEKLMAVYARGRITWDSKALDGFAISNPEITRFRFEGKPSVSIREIEAKV